MSHPERVSHLARASQRALPSNQLYETTVMSRTTMMHALLWRWQKQRWKRREYRAMVKRRKRVRL
jgi:hypothetical protein